MRPRPATFLACGALLGACTLPAPGGMRPRPVTATGLAVAEQALRTALTAGSWEDAVVRATDPQRGAPDDALLRALYAGTTEYYAGRWRESAAAFERAATLADERVTWRLSRGALALASSDRALPYVPGENERLLAHQYALLAYAQAGDREGAAVEARRIGALLERRGSAADPRERATHAVLRYLSGVAFEMAGERGDAAVAYRNAGTLGADRVLPEPANVARRTRATAPSTGEVVVLIERGFVAHRVPTRMQVRVAGDSAADDAARLATRLGAALGDGAIWSDDVPALLALDDAPGRHAHGGRVLALAWPALRREGDVAPLAGLVSPTDAVVRIVSAWRGLGAGSAGPSHTPVLLRADLSDAVAADFRRDRNWLVTRLVARAAVRQVVVAQARRRARPLGDLVASLGSMVEQADTRSWHLLPARLEVLRLRLPAGAQPLAVDVGGRTRQLGVVPVVAGGLTLFPVRLWRDDTPAAAHVAAAGI